MRRIFFSDSRLAISTTLMLVAIMIVVVVVVVAGGIALLQQSEKTTRAPGKLLMEFAFPSTLVASSDLSWMNYSVTFTAMGNLPSNLSLSVTAPPDLSARFFRNNVSLVSNQSTATLQIAAAPSTPLGTYQIVITANGAGTNYSQIEQVHVLKYLVVTIDTTFVPQNITVVQGGTVTWLRLNGILGQYDNGDHDVDFSSGISIVSPTLNQYASWSYQFDQTGNYSYYCKYHPFMTGEIIVVS